MVALLRPMITFSTRSCTLQNVARCDNKTGRTRFRGAPVLSTNVPQLQRASLSAQIRRPNRAGGASVAVDHGPRKKSRGGRGRGERTGPTLGLSGRHRSSQENEKDRVPHDVFRQIVHSECVVQCTTIRAPTPTSTMVDPSRPCFGAAGHAPI